MHLAAVGEFGFLGDDAEPSAGQEEHVISPQKIRLTIQSPNAA